MKQNFLNPLLESISIARNNLDTNYRYHGGYSSALRGLVNAWNLSIKKDQLVDQQGDKFISAITFSVVPILTFTWALAMEKALADFKHTLWIGDCSGGLGNHGRYLSNTQIFPILNGFLAI